MYDAYIVEQGVDISMTMHVYIYIYIYKEEGTINFNVPFLPESSA